MVRVLLLWITKASSTNLSIQNFLTGINIDPVQMTISIVSKPFSEYKPTMMALLNGDLEQERKNVVQSIISCKDPEKKASLVKKFKNFWAKEREEKAARERELAELAEQRRAKKAAEDLKHDIPENILEFSDNGMTLINRLINKKIDQEKRTQIYDRLMEPDVDADVKNLALQLISITKFTLMKERVEQFIKEKEEAVILEAQRKEDMVKRKEKQAADAEKRKDWAWSMKQKLNETKEKNERLMKRDLMLKMRAKQRKGEKAFESSGQKLSQEVSGFTTRYNHISAFIPCRRSKRCVPRRWRK